MDYQIKLFSQLDEELKEIASDLVSAYDADIQSRGDWEDTIKKGMDLLGLKLEEVQNPFPGACSAHHPLMIEAAVQFHAQALKELFPSNGPVKTQIVGEKTKEIESQAERVKDFMNYQVTEQMEEYFDDLDQMLFYLPIVGSCFKKVYYDAWTIVSCLSGYAMDFTSGYNVGIVWYCSSYGDTSYQNYGAPTIDDYSSEYIVQYTANNP